MVKVNLMSDPSAVITQVNPNDPPSTQDLNNHQVDSRDFVSGANSGGPKGGSVSQGGTKSYIASLLCCFGSLRRRNKNGGSSGQPAAPTDHDGPSQPPNQENSAPIDNADFVVPIEIDLAVHQVYVLKRPHVDDFLQKMGEMYECVLFTASLAKYADPVADLLDKWGVFKARLFRDSCVYHRGNYVKDLGRLGRDLKEVIIIDNSPASYIFHPENAIPVNSWFDDMSDTELKDIIPLMVNLSHTDDIYPILRECVASRQQAQQNNGVPIPPQQQLMTSNTITSPPPPVPLNPIARVSPPGVKSPDPNDEPNAGSGSSNNAGDPGTSKAAGESTSGSKVSPASSEGQNGREGASNPTPNASLSSSNKGAPVTPS